MERGFYNTNNQPKKATFKYEQEGIFCLGVAKVESQDGTIIGKCCPVFDYTEKKIVMISAYKQEMTHELERVKKLTRLRCHGSKKLKQRRYGSVNL